MKEHEFKCKKCGNTWYATDKDIRESRKQQSNIQRAKLQNVSGFRGKKYTKRSAEIARMQETQSNQDPTFHLAAIMSSPLAAECGHTPARPSAR